MILSIRPLTQEQRQTARQTARQAVVRSIGPRLGKGAIALSYRLQRLFVCRVRRCAGCGEILPAPGS